MSKHITIALTDDEEAHLAAAAQYQETSLEGAMSALIRESIQRKARLVELVEEGREAIRQGRTFTHQEVVAQSQRRREELLATRAK